jgi:signal transduction histidine kinase
MRLDPFCDLGLRTKIRVITGIVSGVALLTAFAAFLLYQHRSSWHALARQYETMARVIGDQSTAALEFGQPQSAAGILMSLRAEKGITSAAIYDRSGALFAKYVRVGSPTVAAARVPVADGRHTADRELWIAEPMRSGDERIGTLVLHSDMLAVRQSLRVSVAIMAWILCGVAALIPFLSGWLGRALSDPLLHLAEVMQRVSHERDYSVRALRRGNDEVGRLIEGFNDMLALIQARDLALAGARDALEARVQERTRRLEQEIESHRQAQRLLVEQDHRLMEAQQIAHLGSWDWQLAAREVSYSDELYRIHGQLPRGKPESPEDLLGCVHPDDRAALAEVLERARRLRETFAQEYRVIRPDGEVRTLHAQGKVVLDDDGCPERMVAAVQDVSERRLADLQIRELNQQLHLRMVELETSNRELETFCYSVSHDLRAPLRAIDGFSQLLLESCAATLDDEGRHYLQRVSSGSQRMAQLIDGLLDLARISRGDLARQPVDLTALSRELLSELQSRDPQRVVEVDVATGMRAEADPHLLRAALGNLLENAWKYSRGRHRAHIEVGVEAREVPVFFVRDDGAGFDMAYAKKLFGAFQRLHSESEFEGTGIGLATVQRIVLRHGGRIWADAAVERGAAFYFTLESRAERHASV